MEIRAQAFAFSTNDEVNNMTFHNYVLINQEPKPDQHLLRCLGGRDVGTATDDYGCDVERGLGYAYNGDADDELTVPQGTVKMPLPWGLTSLKVPTRSRRLTTPDRQFC